MNSPATTISDDEAEQSPSSLWDLTQNEGPSFQEQFDASHQKCRTDWRISETIIVAQFKALRREIAQLKGEVEDEEMDGSGNTEQSGSPLWVFLQGEGPCLQEHINASHQKCRADWKISESIIASELKASRRDVAQLQEREAKQKERLDLLEITQFAHEQWLRFLMNFSEILRKKLNSLFKDAVARLPGTAVNDASDLRLRIRRFFYERYWDFEKTIHDLDAQMAAEEAQRTAVQQ